MPLSRASSLAIADNTPLPWLNMIVNEMLAIRLLMSKTLISHPNDLKYDGVSDVVLEGRRKWISSSFFSLGLAKSDLLDQASLFLCKFVDDYENPLCVELISVMRKLVPEDRRNAPKEDSHLVHVTCAALIWHKGLAAEALAIAEKRREGSPSKPMISLWRFAQKLRQFLDEGDLHNAKEQSVGNEQSDLDETAALYPGADSSVRSKVICDCLDRACQLLQMNSVVKTSPAKEGTKKLWKAAASLLGLQAQSNADSPTKPDSLFNVSKLASTKKWLHDTVSSRSTKKSSLRIEESIMSFVQRGPTSQTIYSMIKTREEAAILRVEGLTAVLKLFSELATVEEKTRVLIGLSEAIHAYDDVHYTSELSGISESSLRSLADAWIALSKAIVDDCHKWLQECGTSVAVSTSTNEKQNMYHRALLCGLSVAILDFRPSDAAALRDSRLLALLSKASHSTHFAIRSLTLKWTELVLHKCCFSMQSADDNLEVSVPTESKDASDALLPSLLQIFQTKVLDVVDSNIPKSVLALNESEIPNSEKEVHLLLKQTVLCSATEPGFVSPHQVVPVNHTFGMWVFRPAGVSDGILFVKGGPVKNPANLQPWSRYDTFIKYSTYIRMHFFI